MGWIVSDYPTKWGTPTAAYISTCSSELRIFPTNLGGLQEMTYFTQELQMVPTIVYETQEVPFVDELGSNVTSNVQVPTTVMVEQLIPISHTCNVEMPQECSVICDLAIYPSRNHRLQDPMNIFERTQVVVPICHDSNLSIYDYIYNAVAEKYPNGVRD